MDYRLSSFVQSDAIIQGWTALGGLAVFSKPGKRHTSGKRPDLRWENLLSARLLMQSRRNLQLRERCNWQQRQLQAPVPVAHGSQPMMLRPARLLWDIVVLFQIQQTWTLAFSLLLTMLEGLEPRTRVLQE